MKRIMLISLAILLMGSLAFAHTLMYDPTGALSDMTNVQIPVYSVGALDAGDVVVWDIDTSTGDNDAYVETTTTADTGVVAGVIWPNAISALGTGTMVIYGMAECDVNASGVGAIAPLCTSTTAGSAGNCVSTDGSGSYAISTATIGASAQGKCFVDVK